MLLKIEGDGKNNNDNPTQTLILALQARGSKMTKEEDFYMAFMDGDVRLINFNPNLEHLKSIASVF
jgi:hypothetical protein